MNDKPAALTGNTAQRPRRARVVPFFVAAVLLVSLCLFAVRLISSQDTLPVAKSDGEIKTAAHRIESVKGARVFSSKTDVLPNLDPFASLALRAIPNLFPPRSASIQTLHDLYASNSVLDAQLAAVNSDDPVVHLNALHMGNICFHESVQLAGRSGREYLESFSRDPKTGKPVAALDQEVAFTELRAKSGPLRLIPPVAIRTEIEAEWTGRQNDPKVFSDRPRDYAKEMAQWRAMVAPETEPALKARGELQARLAKECRNWSAFHRDFFDAYRIARDKFASEGVIGVLIGNRKAGWESGLFGGELNERDYALVETGLREWRPDVFAALLLGLRVSPATEASGIPDESGLIDMSLSYTATRLAACDLGVSYCGATSSSFRENCHFFGGCDQPDVREQMRYVLARDGADPNALDRVVADLVAKIRAGNLDALGIRRKK